MSSEGRDESPARQSATEVTPAQLGEWEAEFEAAARVGLTSFFSVPNDRAVGAALMLHASSVLPTLALGFLFLIQDGLDFNSMQKLATAAAEGETR